MDKDDDDDDAVEADDVVDDDDDDETRERPATTRDDDDDATGGVDDDAGVGFGERTIGGCRRRRCGRERVIHGVDAEKEENAERERARDGGARSRRGEHYE